MIASTRPGPVLAVRGLTRREGLIALALVAPAGILAACTGSAEPSPPSASASAPPADLAAEVAGEESALIATYDALLAAVAGLGDEATALLTLIRDQHVQHLEALGATAAQPAASTGTAPATACCGDQQSSSLRSAKPPAAGSAPCVAADEPDLARLLTFIGASEASHVPALRDLGAGA